MASGDTQAMRELLEEKLESTGELGRLRASIMESGLKALAAESPDDVFYQCLALKALKASGNRIPFAVVIDFLKELGLHYTVNVLLLEASLKQSEVDLDRKKIAETLSLSADTPILSQYLAGGVSVAPQAAALPPKVASSAASPAATAVVAPVTAAPAKAAVAAAAKPTPKSVDDTFYISRWEDKTIVRHGQLVGQACNIEYLKNCKLQIFDPCDSLNIDDIDDSEIVIAACENSVFLRNCKNTKVIVACKQLRCRDCVNVELFLFAGTDPVVETSTNVTVRPYNLRSPNLAASFKKANLDAKVNRFVHVYDFSADDSKIPKPHFTVKFPDPSVSLVTYGEHLGPVDTPLEVELLLKGEWQPGASSESGANKSLDIKTGSGVWKAGVAAAEPAIAPAPKPATKVPALPIPALPIPSAAASGTTAASDYSSDESPAKAPPAITRPATTTAQEPPAAAPAGKLPAVTLSSVPKATGTLKRDSESDIDSFEDSDEDKPKRASASDEDSDTF